MTFEMAIVLTIDYMEDLILETAVERSLEIFLFFYHHVRTKMRLEGNCAKMPITQEEEEF